MAIDPVCKMKEGEKTARFEDTSMRGRDILLLCAGCKKAFEENPEEYTGA